MQKIKPQLVLDKIPPQSPELESTILGALLLEKNAFFQIAEFFNHSDFFYKNEHKLIFEAFLELKNNGINPDILTIVEQLQKNGKLDSVGGPYYISTLTDKVSSSANLEYHARIVMQKYALRNMIDIGHETIKSCYDETNDVFEVYDNASAQFLNLTEKLFKKQAINFKDGLAETLKRIEEIEKRRHHNNFIGVISGFLALDNLTGGWQEPAVIILAARPGMGKTSLALNFAINALKDPTRDNKVAVFSLEMNTNQLNNRILSLESGIPLKKIIRAELTSDEKTHLQKTVGFLENKQLFIDDTPSISVLELKNKLRTLKHKHKGLDLVIIDYLQLMSAGLGDKSKNTNDQVSNISKNIKAIAKELEVPIIMLSQLSRAVEQRGGLKIPQLSDLRDSGAIEQDADIVLFPYRPDYYGFTTDEADNSTENLCQLIIAKHRDGPLETVKLKFDGELTKFADWEKDFSSLQPNQNFDNKQAAANDNDTPF